MTNSEYITAIRKQYNADIMHICENKPPECFSGFNACLSCNMKATCRMLYKPTVPTIPTNKPRLIAAAPDLLEACKACVSIIGVKDIGPAKEKAQAAIAKATGE